MVAEAAPVALFAFRRPDHLAACVAALASNPTAAGTDLIVFCDGPKTPADAPSTARVRDVAHRIEGFRSLRVVERESNLGLAASVIGGVTEVLGDHERIIVLEDDIVVSVDFLRYMNEGLEMYAADERVVSIHAFSYAVPETLPETFFLRGADCWGWATWRRGWQVFEPDGATLLARLDASGEADLFDFDDGYGYRRMLQDQIAGTNDSWAVRWYASAFLAGRFTLYPGTSLVENIGQDGSGTHSVATEALASVAGTMRFPLTRVPVEDSVVARAAITRTMKASGGSRSGGLWARKWGRLRP